MPRVTLKIERPLCTNESIPQALYYTKDQGILGMIPWDESLAAWFWDESLATPLKEGGDLVYKIYVKADVKENGEVRIIRKLRRRTW